MIDTEAKRRKALELFNLSDVWGIGRQTFQKLNYYGIHSALELANKKKRKLDSLTLQQGNGFRLGWN